MIMLLSHSICVSYNFAINMKLAQNTSTLCILYCLLSFSACNFYCPSCEVLPSFLFRRLYIQRSVKLYIVPFIAVNSVIYYICFNKSLLFQDKNMFLLNFILGCMRMEIMYNTVVEIYEPLFSYDQYLKFKRFDSSFQVL